MERRQNAVTLLKADHKAVEKLFKQFEKLKQDEDVQDEKSELVAQICQELTVHTQIEEEIFYPVLRAAIDDSGLMDEAQVEHASAKDFIEQLQSMQPDDDCYDAKVTVLGEYVMHHVKEEEEEMFPKAKEADLDLLDIGERLAQRKEELETELQSVGASRSGRSASRRSGTSRHTTH